MWILSLAITHVFALRCYEYSCKSNFDNFEPGQCIMSENSDFSMNLSITIDVCTDLYFSYCPPVDVNISCQLPPQTPIINNAYIGEPCNTDENCISSWCANKICQGLGQGDICSSDLECGIGLYCNGQCNALITIGGTCTKDEACMNDLTCFKGKCTEYLSQEDDTEVSVCENQINLQCTSGGCFTVSDKSYCLPSVSSQKIPNECVFRSSCEIMIDSLHASSFTTDCQCAQNGFATSVCALSTGDAPYVNYINYLSAWISSEYIHKCHTTQRLSLKCAELNWDYKNWVKLSYFQYLALNYPTYLYSDSCVQKVFQKNFRDIEAAYLALEKETDDSSSFSNKLLVSLGLIFILIN